GRPAPPTRATRPRARRTARRAAPPRRSRPLRRGPHAPSPLLDHLERTEQRDFASRGSLLMRGPDEAAEERVAVHRARAELGMELRREEPGMSFELDHLHEGAIRRRPAEHHARLL